MLLGLQSLILDPNNRCQKQDTSIVEACIPSPIEGHQVLNEVVRFFVAGFLLPIAELFS